jgi:hypothetical protein
MKRLYRKSLNSSYYSGIKTSYFSFFVLFCLRVPKAPSKLLVMIVAAVLPALLTIGLSKKLSSFFVVVLPADFFLVFALSPLLPALLQLQASWLVFHVHFHYL